MRQQLKAKEIVNTLLAISLPAAAIILLIFKQVLAFHIIGGFFACELVVQWILILCIGKDFRKVAKSVFEVGVACIISHLILKGSIADAALLGVCMIDLIWVYIHLTRQREESQTTPDTQKSITAEQKEELVASSEETDSNLNAIGKEDKRTREMVDEAVYRMKMLGMDKDIINDFEVNNNVQIYEPPFGCGYHLDEEEDSELIKEIERKEQEKGLLVWGVIRCSMTYNRQPVTIDCLLFVSNGKNNWRSERRALKDGIPYTYTICKEFPNLKDHGNINIYMSEGATPLRR